jgi:hypothetical protein
MQHSRSHILLDWRKLDSAPEYSDTAFRVQEDVTHFGRLARGMYLSFFNEDGGEMLANIAIENDKGVLKMYVWKDADVLGDEPDYTIVLG